MENDEMEKSVDPALETDKAGRDFKMELALFFILGLLLGITAKTEAAKRITIGFNDYKIHAAADSYDVSEIKKKLIEQAQKDASGQPEQDPSLQGSGTCQ